MLKFFLFAVVIFTAPCFCFSQNASNQTDTSQTLPTAHISAQHIRQNTIGEQRENWEKTALQRNNSNHLGALLANESGAFVKSYGLGSSATTSIRGGSAGHTAVIWNGLPVDNPMLGQLDFSLMPVSLVDEVTLSLGGNSASWGSGAIGGTVFLENNPSFENGHSFKVQSELGSFGWYDQQARWHFGNKKWSHGIRFTHQQAENDFQYRTTNGSKKKQTNAAFNQNNLLHELYWKIKPNQLLSVHTWLQKMEREIPPTTVQNCSVANQSDEFWRTSINWKIIGKNSTLTTKGGLFRELQNYRDDQILLNADNNFWKAIGEVEQAWRLNENQHLQVGINHIWLQAEAGAYPSAEEQNRSAIYAIYRHSFSKWDAQFNLRQELVDGEFAPMVPALGIDVPLAGWLAIRSKLTRNYRLPTLNDLFWQPGGNKDLIAESGWSEEVGLKVNLPENRTATNPSGLMPVTATYSISIFNRNIDNWIQWGIRDGESFYSANNISKVWSRGIEQRATIQFQLNQIKVEVKGGYDFIKSTYQEAIENPKVAIGQQLRYVPKHQAFGGILCIWKNFELNYQHQFTGTVEAQNVENMPNYHIGTARIAYDWQLAKLGGHIYFKTENLWDADYRIIERRAMPGRHFRFGASFKIG